MKQGRCPVCGLRWVSDRDFGRKDQAPCPNGCGALRATTAYSHAQIHFHPSASKAYRDQARADYQAGKRVYVG